jgi:hypothetical protein
MSIARKYAQIEADNMRASAAMTLAEAQARQIDDQLRGLDPLENAKAANYQSMGRHMDEQTRWLGPQAQAEIGYKGAQTDFTRTGTDMLQETTNWVVQPDGSVKPIQGFGPANKAGVRTRLGYTPMTGGSRTGVGGYPTDMTDTPMASTGPGGGLLGLQQGSSGNGGRGLFGAGYGSSGPGGGFFGLKGGSTGQGGSLGFGVRTTPPRMKNFYEISD